MLSQLKLVKKGGQSRCLSHRGVHHTEVSISQRCPSPRGVHLTEVSISQVSISQKRPSHRGACPSHRGVYLTEVFVSQKCPSHRSVHFTEMSISQSCPLGGSWLFWSSPGNRTRDIPLCNQALCWLSCSILGAVMEKTKRRTDDGQEHPQGFRFQQVVCLIKSQSKKKKNLRAAGTNSRRPF